MKESIKSVLVGAFAAVVFVIVFFAMQSLVSLDDSQSLSFSVFVNNFERLF